MASLLIAGYFTSRIAVPLRPTGIPQVHQTPSYTDGQRPEQGKASPESLGTPLLRTVPEPARPIEQHESSQQQPQGQGQQNPPGGGWTGEIFPGFKVTDLVNISLTMSLVFLGVQQLRTYREQAKIMKGQLEAATAAANAANTANVVSRESLIASRRPWVLVAINVGQRGLYFESNNARIHLTFRMTNTGATPATYVRIIARPRLIAGPSGIIQELNLLCIEGKETVRDPRMLGTTIFPGETQVEEMVYGFADADEIENERLNHHGYVFPTILGCIDYLSTFDQATHHQSRFIFDLSRASPIERETGASYIIRLDDGDVPPDHLVLRKSIRAGSFYAD